MGSLTDDLLVVTVVVVYLGLSALIAYLLSDKKRGEPPTQIEGQDNSNATNVDEPIAIRITNAPPTSEDQKQYEQKNYRLQRKSFVVGFITLAVLIGYTGINWLLYKTTTASYHADQRPWVGVTYISIDEWRPGYGASVPIGQIRMKNFGPRVARKVIFIGGQITYDESDQICKDAERDCGAAWSFATGEGHEGWSGTGKGPLGVTLFPDQEYRRDFDMLGTIGVLTPADKLPIYIYVPGCVVYLDQFGDKHKTRICFEALYNGHPLTNEDWQQCRECNDAD